MSVESAPTMDSERAFARSRRLCLWGLLVALPLALWVQLGDAWKEYRKQNQEEIVNAPVGAPFSFLNSDWLLESTEAVPAVPASALPSGTTYVRVRIAVSPKDAAIAERLRYCSVFLLSKDGRRWTPSGNLPREPDNPPRSCGGTYRVHPEAGKTFRFEQVFTVPTSVAGEVEPVIQIPKKRFDAPREPLLRLRRR